MNEPGEPPANVAATPLSPIAEGELGAGSPMDVAPSATSPVGLAASGVGSPPASTSPPSSRSLFGRFGFGSRSSAPAEDGSPLERPTFVFFGNVAGTSLLADVTTKAWAEVVLSKRIY